MIRRPNSREEAEPRSDLPPAVDIALERTNGAAKMREVPSITAPADSMTRDTILASCVQRTWTLDPDSMILFRENEPVRGAEEFRALRSRLYQVQAKTALKSLLVVSALPGEGRSYVAASLAQVLALQPESRVLLLDADLRSPRLHQTLGTSSEPGFSEYLLQEAEEFGIMQKGEADNLFFIPSGRLVSGPTELVANGRLKSLIDRIEPLFDWIIIDSPAAIAVSDASLLANYCDGVLMVVRSHSTPFDVVRKARERFRDESLLGVVLNVIENAKPSGARSSERISNQKSGF